MENPHTTRTKGCAARAFRGAAFRVLPILISSTLLLSSCEYVQKAEKALGMGGKSQTAQAAPAKIPVRPALPGTFKEKKELLSAQAPAADNSFPFNSSLDSSIVGEINSRGPWVFWTIKTGDGNVAIYSQGKTDARLYLIDNAHATIIDVCDLPAFIKGGAPVPVESVTMAVYTPEDMEWLRFYVVAELFADAVTTRYAIMRKPIHEVVEF